MWRVALLTVFLAFLDLRLIAANRVLLRNIDFTNSSGNVAWQDDLQELLEEAGNMIETAMKKLQKGDKATLKLAAKWFGEEAAKDAGVKKELVRVMKSTAHVLNNFKAVKKNCDKDTFAYVFPEKFPKRGLYEMILCPLYFKSPDKVQLETIIHEASHHKKSLLDDVCLDSIEGHGRHQRETTEFVVMPQSLVKEYSGEKSVYPDLQFDIDVNGDDAWDSIYFVDPKTLEVLEDDDEDDEDEFVHDVDEDEDEDYDYDEDDEDDEDEDGEEVEEAAVVHRIVDVKIGGKVRKNMALVQLNPADDCDDKAYGRKECAQMAKASPVKALRNADSFCYFVVDASSGRNSLLEEANNTTALGMPCNCEWASGSGEFHGAYQQVHGPAADARQISRARNTFARICGC